MPVTGCVEVIRAPGPGLNALLVVIEQPHLVAAAGFNFVVEVNALLDVSLGVSHLGEVLSVDRLEVIVRVLVVEGDGVHDQAGGLRSSCL